MTIKELSDRYPFQLGFITTVVVVTVFVLIGTSVSGSSTAVAEPTPAYEPEPARVETEEKAPVERTTPEGPKTTIEDGTFLVNKEVKPGTYRTEGGENCYFERRSDTSGSVDGVIANGNPEGQEIVTIEASDVAFKSQNCGIWVRI